MKRFYVKRVRAGYAVFNRSTSARESGFYSNSNIAQMRCDAMNRALEAARTIRRKCMCCRREFQSEGIHNRLCKNCGAHGQDKQMVEPCTLPR